MLFQLPEDWANVHTQPRFVDTQTEPRHLKQLKMEKYEGNKKFECNICNTLFVLKSGLKRHISSVHEKKKPFTCNICDSNFANHSDIKFHVASVHQGNKQFECNICNASFVLKSGLKMHISSVHEEKNLLHVIFVATNLGAKII